MTYEIPRTEHARMGPDPRLGGRMSERVKWEPIDTAPKDGRTVVDLWCVTDDGGSASFYFGNTKCGVTDRVMWQGRVTECWWKDGAWRPRSGLSRLYALTVEPTHWIPLPRAPEPTPNLTHRPKRAL